MATERSRAASGDGSQDVEPLVAKPGAVLFSKAVALNAKDIGHSTVGRFIYLFSGDTREIPG